VRERQEPNPVEHQAELLELEAELSRNGLLVERLQDNTLKVRLSSDGIFDFNSVQLKNSAGSSLEELADVLRNQDQRPCTLWDIRTPRVRMTTTCGCLNSGPKRLAIN